MEKKQYIPPSIILVTGPYDTQADACGPGSTASGICGNGNMIAYPGRCITGYDFGDCGSGSNPDDCIGGSGPYVWPAL